MPVNKLSRNQFSALNTNEFIDNVMENYDSLVKIKNLSKKLDLESVEVADLIKFAKTIKEIVD